MVRPASANRTDHSDRRRDLQLQLQLELEPYSWYTIQDTTPFQSPCFSIQSVHQLEETLFPEQSISPWIEPHGVGTIALSVLESVSLSEKPGARTEASQH